MIDKKFLQGLKKEYQNQVSERRQIISLANVILHESKRVIFALHRGQVKEASEQLAEIEKMLNKLEKNFGFARAQEEGAYKAGVEEYVEAKLFAKILNGEKIEKIKTVKLSVDSYLGGISDTTGELVRLAINKAANGELEEVKKIKNTISDVMAELVEFDMTGYLRTKYDQAKQNLKKIEQISYEINLRR